MRFRNTSAAFAAALSLVAAASLPVPGASAAAAPSVAGFLGGLHTVSQLASTAPANGDVNPYGVAVVPTSLGRLIAGDTLVSNFNDKANVQGTGATIVE